MTTTQSAAVTEFLLAAVQDPTPGQDVVFGVADRKLVQTLPRVVELLRHPRMNIRLVAAQAFAVYGPLAVPYLPRLEEAIQVETDLIVKKTMEGTINVLTRGNEPRRPPG